MRFDKLILAILFWVLGAAGLHLTAQTTTTRATWKTTDAPAVANTFTYTLRDGEREIVCAGGERRAQRRTAITAATRRGGDTRDGADRDGRCAVTSPFGSVDSDPLVGSKPNKPTSFTITITVSVS